MLMSLEDEGQAHRLAEVFAALSHPRRVVILNCLLERERSVSDLCDCERLQPSTQPNVSQHLAILRSAHLVKERRDGSRVLYRVASNHLAALVKAGTLLMDEQLVAAR
jgi:DNA-binding transcriptional ArsR family regulator